MCQEDSSQQGGSGYPEGLKGEDIPQQTRIITLADAYDALASDRPYRKAMKGEYAIKELAGESRTHFDSSLVKIFQRIHTQGQVAGI